MKNDSISLGYFDDRSDTLESALNVLSLFLMSSETTELGHFGSCVD